MGHGPKRCPEPKKEEEVSSWGAPAGGNSWEAPANPGTQGGWDNNTADAGADAGGWTGAGENTNAGDQATYEDASAW